MEATASAYLDYSLRSEGGNLDVLDGHPDEMTINHYPLIVVDLFSAYQADIPMFGRDEFVASGLVNLGLFPCSPYDLTLGIQPYVRALCDLHGVPFRTYLSTQFSVAFDVPRHPHWRLKNACPACLYKLEDEEDLSLPVLTTQNGNNSLSRHGQMERAEDATPSDVDKWATEGLEEMIKGHSSDPYEWNEEEDGCSERWSNMREEITSRALGMYDETGIFLSLCQHGFVLVVLDMIRSGELAKYGFAVVNHLLNVIGQVAVGYDIGCKFGKMVNAHPVLGPLAGRKASSQGVGLEDLEECETFFSKSNGNRFIKHTDVFDTYQSLSLLLVTKYRRALKDVSVFEEWLRLEKACLDGLSTEPLEETLKMEYYQKLVNLDESEARLSDLCGAVAHEDPASRAINRIFLQLAARNSAAACDGTPRQGCAEWSEAAVLVVNRRYQRALDKLQGLVIARLFELTKCHMSGTGYKMRKHIAKALQARSHAIKTAIEQYNAAAAALEVPRKPFSWEEVVDYTFLSDFDLLRTSRRDILTEGWAQPAGREAMDNYFKLLRADEEIKRLNIEIPRFVLYMRDEEVFLRRQEEHIRIKHGNALAHQVALYREQQGRFNDGHRYRLLALSKLPGFSGSIMPGVPEGFNGATLGDEDEEDSDGEAETLNATFVVLRITEDSGE
ncbi:hypothetical protein B0H14DRAFT_3461770 [Mycena olivaceomarginata]|nr:hypothetical protein B0H14DRAFT_3461770 [Mycena olivaceomarginata]